MSRLVGILMVAVVSGCGGVGPPDPRNVELTAIDAGPPRTSGCATDTDCPAGMLCEGCDDGFFTCVPGCRTDAQCGQNMICFTSVTCLTCPCPSGYCDLSPCRDFDGDGYAPATDGTCPGKLLGDCNDGNARAHPGGVELCANGVDDDCDGKRDAADDECDACQQGQSYCSSSINCGDLRYCERGCCQTCPSVSNPACDVGECLIPQGKDTKGCVKAGVCGACPACSSDYAPVCGKNFQTYTNECHALAAGTTVLHTGECRRGEGAPCEGEGQCYYGQFCRDFGASKQCALTGTCSVDADCQYVTSVVTCGDAGIGTWACRQERCSPQCP
ncbi:MAG TPA: MopE-related protein [Archangium sp.]